jgi:hypothetical protein
MAKGLTPVTFKYFQLLIPIQILPDSLYCKLYVLTVVVQTIIDLAIEGDLLLRFHEAAKNGQLSNNDDVTSRKMPVYLSIFVIAQ